MVHSCSISLKRLKNSAQDKGVTTAQDSPVVSVIVPVYNVRNYLYACVSSILRQTFDNFELILVDDGSTDGSGELCEKLSKTDDRILCLHKKNGGLSDARNYGINHMRGTYVTFIDSDDWVEKNYLEYLYTNICLQDSDISTCVFMIRRGNIAKPWRQLRVEPLVVTGRDALLSMLYEESVNVSAHGKLYRATLFNDIRYPVGKRYEDVGTTYKLLLKAKSVAIGGAALYNYFMRSGSITHAGNIGIFDRYQLAYQVYSDLKNIDCIIERAARRYLTFHELSVLRACDLDDIEQSNFAQQIKQDVIQHRKKVLSDARTPLRDRIALYILPFGLDIYQWAWSIYAQITNRR